MKIKAVIIGFSHMHVNEVALYISERDDMELLAVSDVASKGAEEIPPLRYTPKWNLQNVKENYCSKVYDDYKEMLDSEKPDIAFILTENCQKPEVVEECAKRGINVSIEKPIAVSLEEADKIKASVDKYGIEAVVNWPVVWREYVMKMKAALDSKLVGEPIKLRYINGHTGPLGKGAKHRGVSDNAEENTVLAIIRFIDRYIEKISELLETEERPEIRESLCDMKKACENIRLEPPKTFHEVCQWTAFFNCASRIYTRDGAGFQMDVLLYPYYERDVKAGILTDEKAKFLIANLLLIDPHYYQISGVDENDKDMTNHLSYLILEAADSINIACNLTVRVHENCDKEFFRKSVYYLLKNKNGWPRFCNDKALCEGYMKNGVDKKTARERIAVGCNWMCVPGKEFPMNDTVKINIAKVMEEALKDMRSEGEKSTERLLEIFEEHLKIAIDTTARGINLHIDHQADVTPELVMNLMMENTIEKGEDISRCASLYTVGVDGAGLAVVADSFGALETRVETDKVLTWDEVYKALDNNFEDERTRLILNSSPKYCHGNTVSDKWAKRLTECWVKNIKGYKMPEGRCLVPGGFSWARTIEYGSKVGPTPNGRRAYEPISHGANPNPHFRNDGAPTAQSNGIASVQCGFGNTAPLQIEFDPKLALDEKGIEIIGNFVKGHFAQGGTLININILDKERILEANENPDLHADLVVRVTGFTAYFASLSPKFRQLVVDRFLEGV